MLKRYQRFQRLSFTEELYEVLEQFSQTIEWDPVIKATVKESDKKRVISVLPSVI